MKISIILLSILSFSCSAPKYTYFFDHVDDPATKGLSHHHPGLSTHNEPITAGIEPIPVTFSINEKAVTALPTAPDDVQPTAPLTKKQVRQELRSFVKQLKNSNNEDKTGPPSIKSKETNPRNNGFAIAGFVLSLVGWFVLWPLVILGIIFSAIGLKSERRGLATAGLIIGIVGIILILVAAQSLSTV